MSGLTLVSKSDTYCDGPFQIGPKDCKGYGRNITLSNGETHRFAYKAPEYRKAEALAEVDCWEAKLLNGLGVETDGTR